tara:strand:- start:719 stop:1138 length:420 start_codon:yes stop_codon:yes gene_type:complete
VETLFIATLPIVGVVVGALLQFWLSRHQRRKDTLAEMQTRAYVDYLRAVADSAQATRRNGPDSSELFARAADAKTRICIYGDRAVVIALSDFEAAGAKLITEEGFNAFLNLVSEMRVQALNESDGGLREKLSPILFGPR